MHCWLTPVEPYGEPECQSCLDAIRLPEVAEKLYALIRSGEVATVSDAALALNVPRQLAYRAMRRLREEGRVRSAAWGNTRFEAVEVSDAGAEG